MRMQKRQDNASSFLEVLEIVIGRCEREELNLFALIAKRIWAKEMLMAFFMPAEENMGERRMEDMSIPVKWEKPPVGRFKLNWDVAFDKIGQCLGAGAVIRDHNGHVCVAKSLKIEGNQTPIMGEALATVAALEFCKERGIHDVILKGDSVQVVQAINEVGSNMSPYGHVVGDIKFLLLSFRSWMVRHVKKDANQVAHGLAKIGLTIANEKIREDDLLRGISNIVLLELNALDV
jgi:ribonuclease HI